VFVGELCRDSRERILVNNFQYRCPDTWDHQLAVKKRDNAVLIRVAKREHRLDKRVFVLEHVGLDGR